MIRIFLTHMPNINSLKSSIAYTCTCSVWSVQCAYVAYVDNISLLSKLYTLQPMYVCCIRTVEHAAAYGKQATERGVPKKGMETDRQRRTEQEIVSESGSISKFNSI